MKLLTVLLSCLFCSLIIPNETYALKYYIFGLRVVPTKDFDVENGVNFVGLNVRTQDMNVFVMRKGNPAQAYSFFIWKSIINNYRSRWYVATGINFEEDASKSHIRYALNVGYNVKDKPIYPFGGGAIVSYGTHEILRASLEFYMPIHKDVNKVHLLFYIAPTYIQLPDEDFLKGNINLRIALAMGF